MWSWKIKQTVAIPLLPICQGKNGAAGRLNSTRHNEWVTVDNHWAWLQKSWA
jgi:hypothetical protein